MRATSAMDAAACPTARRYADTGPQRGGVEGGWPRRSQMAEHALGGFSLTPAQADRARAQVMIRRCGLRRLAVGLFAACRKCPFGHVYRLFYLALLPGLQL